MRQGENCCMNLDTIVSEYSVPKSMLHSSLGHYQPTTPTFGQSPSPDCTTLLAQYLWSLSLLCNRPDSLELSVGQPPKPGAQKQ